MRDLITKDLGWKLFSLFLATAFWLTANRILHEKSVPEADTTVRTVTYDNLPVTVVSAIADVRAFHVAPAAVKIMVAGPAAVMNTLQADQLHATVTVGVGSLASGLLLPVEISLPAQVAVTRVEPDKVLVIVPSAPDKKP
jgi:YbbR domain-containing protein